jgi:hypothetical protein
MFVFVALCMLLCFIPSLYTTPSTTLVLVSIVSYWYFFYAVLHILFHVSLPKKKTL